MELKLKMSTTPKEGQGEEEWERKSEVPCLDGHELGKCFRKLTEFSFPSESQPQNHQSQCRRHKRWTNTITVRNNVLTLYIMQIVSPLIDTC